MGKNTTPQKTAVPRGNGTTAAKAKPPTPEKALATSVVPEGKFRNGLIFGTLGLFAAIIFGLLYLFVIAPAAPAEGGGWSVGWFLFSFATGLTMIVMPCTLPLAFVIVPLSMGKGLVKGLSMAVAFGVGIAVTLSIYGVIAAVLGSFALDSLGTPLEVVKNWVYFVAGIFAFVFALSEIGLLNVHMPTYSGAAPAFIQKRQEVFKAFLLGLFLGNIGVGCPHPATPLLLIEIASSGDILYGWLMFLVHAIGRVLPLLLLAFMAILGVNGLNWLLTRKDMVERVTGWAMVFVAGFILTLGLFTHDWWVNSGIHTALEAVTQEAFFNTVLNENFDTAVAHLHGPEEGTGLFGLPLHWGHWFLVIIWLIPMWWWWSKKRHQLLKRPSFKIKALEKKIDQHETDRRQVESLVNLEEIETNFDLSARHTQLDVLEAERRKAEEQAQYGETGAFKEPLAREYEVKILKMHRNYLLVISVFLLLVFTYFMPSNFYYKSLSEAGHESEEMDEHGHEAGLVDEHAHEMEDGTMMDNEAMRGIEQPGTPFTTSIEGLPNALEPETVTLEDGDSYDITAYYVKKEVGNRTLRMLAYNGSVPGPFIKAPQGAEITINFTNNTDVDQTIHSHGIRIDNNSDGVPGVTQDTVEPGGSHMYTVKFIDAGVYWYHPHTRDDYGQELGLYGNYLVDPESEYITPANREVPLIIDDILIENDRIVDFYREVTNFALLGRFGNEYLVNGEVNYTLTAKEGEAIRFLVTNVSNARTYNLSIPGAEMKLIGADAGLYEREEFTNSFLISPAERMIVEVYFDNPGTYLLTHTMPDGEVTLASFVVSEEVVSPWYGNEFRTLNANQAVVDEFADFRDYLSREADKKLLLTVALEGQVDHSVHTGHAHPDEETTEVPKERLETIQWDDPTMSDAVNTTKNVTWKMIDEDTGLESMNIKDWVFSEGDLIKIRLTNDATADHVMQHPIHLHGQRFVVLSENGVPNDNLAWKDTVLVFPGEVVEILVEMSNLGEWMSHCHISEHLHAGMMMQFRVENQDGYATGDEYRSATQSSVGHDIVDSRTEFTFKTEVDPSGYQVVPLPKNYRSEHLEEVTISIFDKTLSSVLIAGDHPRPLSITFVKSDDSQSVYTYPGIILDAALEEHGEEGHDDGDGHHDAQPAPTPADDGHDHLHMNKSDRTFSLVSTAYAHGGVDDGHPDQEGRVYSYTMPVLFPERGFYRAFVEFVPEGESTPVVLTFDVEVAASGFSIDNFGWSDALQWWILLIVSLILTGVLSWWMYRYVVVRK